MFTPRVLIADDDGATAASLQRQFKAAGWEVMITRGAEESAALAAMHRPDMVLLDVNLGTAIFERLGNVHVAVMAEEVSAELREKVTAAGAFAVLQRPIKLSSMMALKKCVQGWQAAPRILISDDDALVVRSLERAARHEGLDPVSETDASHVVGLAKEVHPQVIVLDINQKAIDGRDVLARLKNDPDTKDIRVVMLTGVEDQLTRHDCLILGADDYVVKPLDPLFFVRIARKIAEQNIN